MSQIDSEIIPNLFLDDFTDNLFLPTNLSDSLNDILYDSQKEVAPSKTIKFILTKEQSPSINLLQKKTSLKTNDSNDEKNNLNGGRWNKDEQNRFAEAVLKFGNDWKKIQNHIFSRNITQVRSHAQKFLMKLKESKFLKNKGLELTLSWTKVMNFLRNTLSYEELKELLFSVEQNDDKHNSKKKNKKNRKNQKLNNLNEYSEFNSNSDTIGENNNSHFLFEHEYDNYSNEKDSFNNIKNKIIRKDEDEAIILQKFIECFNSPSGEITLNSSFEENSHEEDVNEFENKFLEDTSVLYRYINI